jgi:Flp pilus assembly protein TadG
VELAIITPFLLILLLGTMEIGNAYNSYLTLVNAAREGARLGARGNVFRPSQVLQVVEQHSGGLRLQADGTVIYTVVTADPAAATPFQATSATLLNNGGTSRFSAGGLRTLQQQLTTSGVSAPYADYLRKERFVVVEVIYEHHTIFGLGNFWLLNLEPIHMYTYTVMPVSAPS